MEREESDLYGLPLDEFVPARAALEKRLRKDGDRERAAAVKKLSKPSVAAWAVNQASRSQPKDRRELIAASAALRDAQEALLAGKASVADLEGATARQRRAIDALVDAASGLLTGDGKALGDATLARVRETLAAVAADAELAELVEAGTLDRERRSAGLGFGFTALGADDAPAREDAPDPKPKKAKAKAPSSKQREKEAKRREREVRAARERVKDAKTDEKGAARRRKAAERDALKAAETLQRAEAAVEAAREGVEAAGAELEAAAEAEREAAAAREAAASELDRLS